MTVSAGCGAEDEEAAEDSAVDCCTCLVNEGCVRTSEYDLCKDTLERGGALQLSGLRDLTCNDDACFEANRCASRTPSGGGNGEASVEGSGDEPAAPADVDGNASGGSGDEYVLVVESATYDNTDLNGQDWDLFGGDVPPDAFVSVRIDGESIGVTETAYDDYTPSWNDEFVFRAGRSTTLSFRFFDLDDASGDDFGGEYVVEDLQAVIDRGGASVSLRGIAVSELTFSIRPN
jgi:hypothetical protein